VAAKITAAGGRAEVALGDLSSDRAAIEVARQALGHFGGIDILVNNASSYPVAGWQQMPASDWVAAYNGNVGGMVRITQALLPQMRERRWGRIIAMASTVGTLPIAVMGAYSASKAAFINIAAGLAKELAGTGLTSNSVSPGLVLTPGVRKILLDTAAQQGWGNDWEEIERKGTALFSSNPVGRIGQPDDVAALVLFLASQQASYCNGSNYRVDGGFVPTVN
jgi:3-oxoacyl-[acyl-carrier protein] reductase